MMKPIAVCSRVDLLQRWQEAFPMGRWVASAAALDTLVLADSQIWLHAEASDAAALGARVRQLAERHPAVPLVVMSAAPQQQAALHAMDQGARGYCHALSTPELLQQVSVVVANGGLWIGPELMKRMLLSVSSALDARGPAHSAELERLSPRERAVAAEVGKGATNKEVARALGITERTVKAHLASAFEKLGVRDRLELVIVLKGQVGQFAESTA